MELVDTLFASLSGTDPFTGVDITIANCKSTYWDEGIVQQLINQVLDEGEITNVAVKKSLRGQKIASRLMDELLKKGTLRGISFFVLEVRKSNSAAIHLYEKSGFTKAGIRRNFYEKPIEDAVIMSKQ